MNANQLINRLTRAELDGSYAPDCRRVIREERERLTLATRSGDAASIRRAMDEASRVARMWGVLPE